jgi:hypothetical protein
MRTGSRSIAMLGAAVAAIVGGSAVASAAVPHRDAMPAVARSTAQRIRKKKGKKSDPKKGTEYKDWRTFPRHARATVRNMGRALADWRTDARAKLKESAKKRERKANTPLLYRDGKIQRNGRGDIVNPDRQEKKYTRSELGLASGRAWKRWKKQAERELAGRK